MKVISTTDLSSYGNDCWIHKSISLVEAFGMYTVITAERITGWFEKEEIDSSYKIVHDLYEAKSMYRAFGGILED
jgi:hypothetical protein